MGSRCMTTPNYESATLVPKMHASALQVSILHPRFHSLKGRLSTKELLMVPDILKILALTSQKGSPVVTGTLLNLNPLFTWSLLAIQ